MWLLLSRICICGHHGISNYCSAVKKPAGQQLLAEGSANWSMPLLVLDTQCCYFNSLLCWVWKKENAPRERKGGQKKEGGWNECACRLLETLQVRAPCVLGPARSTLHCLAHWTQHTQSFQQLMRTHQFFSSPTLCLEQTQLGQAVMYSNRSVDRRGSNLYASCFQC